MKRKLVMSNEQENRFSFFNDFSLKLICEFLDLQRREFVKIIHVCKFWYSNRIQLSKFCKWMMYVSNVHKFVELELKPKSLTIFGNITTNNVKLIAGFKLHTFGFFHGGLHDTNFDELTTVMRFTSSSPRLKIPPNIHYLSTDATNLPLSNTVKHIVHYNIYHLKAPSPNTHGFPALEIYESGNFKSIPNFLECKNLTSLSIGCINSHSKHNVDNFKAMLPHLVNLQRLYIFYLDDFSLLSNMKDLKLLQCRKSGEFKDLNDLSCLAENLEVLELPGCQVLSFNGLKNLKNLRVLNIDSIQCSLTYGDLPLSLMHISVMGTRSSFDFKHLPNLKSVRTQFVSKFRSNANPKTEFYFNRGNAMIEVWCEFELCGRKRIAYEEF